MKLVRAFGMFALLASLPSPARAGVMESWYLSRGRSNLEIGNYQAAIEAFEKAVEQNPGNREAMRGLGLSYEAQGLKDKAVTQYDRYLEKFPDDHEIALKQAENLSWSRYAYRREDALKYYRQGLRHQDDPQARLKYAQLLSEKQETSGEAIKQYERVLASHPRNAEAHRGLARALAWNHDPDRALYHEKLARQYGGGASGDGGLRRDLSTGREPALSGAVQFLTQAGGNFDLSGIAVPLRGKRDFGPFVTAAIEAGGESYWNPRDSAGGAFFNFDGEYRIDPARRIDAQLGYHRLGGQGGGRNLTFRAQYSQILSGSTVRPGFKRELVADSLLALAGTAGTGPLLGAARLQAFYAEIEFHPGPATALVTPSFGWVSTANLEPNTRLSLDLKGELPWLESGSWSLSALYLSQLAHYGSDQSGFAAASTLEPLPGGYFSPSFFWSQSPQASARWELGDRQALSARFGPSFQLVTDAVDQGAFRLGLEAHAAYDHPLGARIGWSSGLDFTQVATVFSRFSLFSTLSYRF